DPPPPRPTDHGVVTDRPPGIPSPTMNRILSALGVVFFAAVMFFALTGAGKGFLSGFFWEAAATLECGGDLVMKIRGKKIDVQDSPVISAGGSCQLTLEDCEIKAPVVVAGGGNAHVTIKGGRIEGTENAIEAGGSMVVTIQGAEVVGPIRVGG